jgi:hypothetical protein
MLSGEYSHSHLVVVFFGGVGLLTVVFVMEGRGVTTLGVGLLLVSL